MCDVPIFYATTEGHTRRICEFIAARIQKHALDSQAIPIASEDASHIDWSRVRGAIVAASLHAQKHQAEAVAFAHRYHAVLSAVPSLFVSVSLAAASKRPESVEAARQIAHKFAADAGWQPSRIALVAGKLAYTQYNWVLRWFMRRIAGKEGGSTDTSRDHDYTDWEQVERLAIELADEIHCRTIASNGEEFFARRVS